MSQRPPGSSPGQVSASGEDAPRRTDQDAGNDPNWHARDTARDHARDTAREQVRDTASMPAAGEPPLGDPPAIEEFSARDLFTRKSENALSAVIERKTDEVPVVGGSGPPRKRVLHEGRPSRFMMSETHLKNPDSQGGLHPAVILLGLALAGFAAWFFLLRG